MCAGLLGPASVTMTEKYTHLAPENMGAAVAALEGGAHSGRTDPNEATRRWRANLLNHQHYPSLSEAPISLLLALPEKCHSSRRRWPPSSFDPEK